ncbi:MAG: virulence factor MviN [Flavobacteriaceae bacterium]|nr:MAG: virulence factor MviN [Flavobacteriaceae bacterium]
MVKNLLLVGGITLVIKFFGFYKETLVASSFGLSNVLDTFFIAVLIPGFIQSVFLGAFKNVFIPNYIAELKTGRKISSFQATGFLITGFISFIFVIIAYLFTDVYLDVFFSGHTEEYYELIKSQFYYLAPCIFFWGFSSLLSGLLNISGEFKYSSLPAIFVPIVIVVCLFFFKENLGNNLLAIGTLIGSILAFLSLLITASRKKIISISYPDFKNKNVQLMLKQVPAKVSSGFLTGMNGIVDQFFAAQLVVGSVAAINYGLKMPAFLIGILVIALTNVLLPEFSSLIIENKKKAYRMFFKILKILFLGATFFALSGVFLSDFLVELFFQRKQFTSEDTQIVSSIQKIFLIYTPFTICGMVIVSFLTSMNKNAIMAYISLGAVLLNIVLDYILIRYFGILGIAICTTIVVILKNLFLLFFTLRIIKLNPE